MITPQTHEWVCSRCAREVPGVGRRFRFAGEKCPRCTNPGCGMVLVSKETKQGEDTMSEPTMKMTPSQVIRAAVAHMEKVGFNQGSFYAWPEGMPALMRDDLAKTLPCCIRGAIGVIASGGEWTGDAGVDEHPAYTCLRKHAPTAPSYKEPVAYFNDNHSFEEVKEWALAAADACERECAHEDASQAPRDAGE